MHQIELRTRDYRFVAHAHILPFQIMPEAVVWGERFFVHREGLVYVEGLCVPAYESQVPPHVGMGPKNAES